MISKYFPMQPRNSPSMSRVKYTRRGRSLELSKRKERRDSEVNTKLSAF